MSDTGKQSPLGVNVNNSLIVGEGIQINPKFTSWAGSSRSFTDYSFGRVCQETVLRVLTWAIHEGYVGNPDGRMYSSTYNNLISIGNGTRTIAIANITSGQIPSSDQFYFDVTYNSNEVVTAGQYIRIQGAAPDGYNGNWLISEVVNSTTFRVYTTAFYGTATANGSFIVDASVPGLGNAKPMIYTWEQLIGPYGVGTFTLGDTQGWGGNTYKDDNPITQWAYLRLLALQAWMEFNFNSTLSEGSVDNPAGYRDFLQSFQNAAGFISYSNNAILAIDNSKDFLDGTFSNMNDLITGDITNVTLSLKEWGVDLVNLGKAIDLSLIEYFGLPSALLKTLAKYNAINRNLSLAIIASGIPTNELGNILGNILQPTIEQERRLYAAFMLTVGDTLGEILISLNCKTSGLESLADLLDPKKLFPNSYKSLTVPLYADSNTTPATTVTTGGTVSNLTNSKIYYLLYTQNGGVNSQLTSPEVVEKVGIQILPGAPLVSEAPISDSITIQEPARGFGSYLATLVPPNIAVTAGAFATAMKQIKNIKEVPIEKFAQVVINLETMAVTNQTPLNTNQGTSNVVPTNLNLRTRTRPLVALGSGPQGSYTVSDFFGCMSGLPYNGSSGNPQLGIPEWGLEGIYNKLKQLATQKLFNIYHELYLAVTWERATTQISQSTYYVNVQPYIAPDPMAIPPVAGQPRIDNWYYTVTFGIASHGGGYGRGSSPLPTIQLTPNNCGGSISIRMGTDDTKIPDEFGRVFETSKDYGSAYLYTTTSVMQAEAPATPTPPEEYLYIQGPPVQPFPVQDDGNFFSGGYNNDPGYKAGSQGGTNSGYNAWHSIESVIQGYINQANQEINYINSTQRPGCVKLNNYWNSTGYQLTIEQRARMMGLRPPLTDPRENWLSIWPTTMYTFTDSLPSYSKNTEPHMYAQTIENIANWDTIGGQSMVAMMRQDRNQARLSAIGIDLDNNIPDKLSYEQQKVLLVNGTLPTGQTNANVPSGAITPSPGSPFVDIPTIPASPVIVRDRNEVVPDPYSGDYPEGQGIVPGSFAGSLYGNLIPPNLNMWYSSRTLMPSAYTVNSAIEEVIRCNCDCWNLA